MQRLEKVRDGHWQSAAVRHRPGESRADRQLTVRGPEALGRLDEDILEQTGETVTKQLRADEREDGDSRVLSGIVSGPSSHQRIHQERTILLL